MSPPLSIFVSHPSDCITDHIAHGDGQTAYDQIQRLAERGHRLHVAYTAIYLSQPLHPNVTLHEVVCRFPSSRVQELEYMWRVRRLFLRLHRIQPFDIIHQFNPVFPGRSALLTGLGIPLVLGAFVGSWPENAEAAPSRPGWLNRLASALFIPVIRMADRRQQKRAAALLLSTPAAERSLHDPRQAHARCINFWCPGVDTDDYAPEENPSAPRPPTILFLGNLELRKGVFTLAEAFRTVWRQRPDARLVFVGHGTQRAALQQYVESDESQVQVEFRGELRGDEKKRALGNADLVAMPSNGEPYGLVALEAMACAKPVVATRAGGLQHLVLPEGGCLVEPGDPAGLAKALLALLERPEQLVEMGRFNRKLAVERFAWPSVIDRLEKVYYSVAGLR